MIALSIVSVVLMAAMTLVDSGNKITRSQTDIAELQNNQRVAQQEVVRMLQMAGIGGLPEGIDPDLGGNDTSGVFPNGLAVAIANNVAENTHIGNLTTTPLVAAGSDVLTVRGVFSTAVYLIEPQIPLTLSSGATTVELQQAPEVGVTQNLDALRSVLEQALADTPPRPEAFIVRDRFNPGAFAVLELDPDGTVLGDEGDPTLTIGLILSSDPGDQKYANQYGRMILGTTLLQGSGGSQVSLPDTVTTVQLPRSIGSIGLLEEYRFYVRQEWDVKDDPSSRPKPALARARLYPGTGDLHPTGSIDVSDDIIDLQISLGVDLPPTDGRVADGFNAAGAAVALDVDEVLYNDPGDDSGLSPLPGSREWAVLGAQVLFARLSTVAQAAQPDRSFSGRDLGVIEDHDLSTSLFNADNQLKVRKRHLQTLVRLRNMS